MVINDCKYMLFQVDYKCTTNSNFDLFVNNRSYLCSRLQKRSEVLMSALEAVNNITCAYRSSDIYLL